MSQERGRAMVDVECELERQDQIWGEQNHDPFIYLSVLGEEYGSACKAALQTKFGGPHAGELQKELIHTAAVAIAMIECLRRGKWE